MIVPGVAVAESLTLTPLVPEARIEPKPAPLVPSMVIDLVMVTAPNPPGSRQSISPPAAVLEMAPAKVLQGAVRLHGLTSSPTPDTQVRVACACADVDGRKTRASNPNIGRRRLVLFMGCPQRVGYRQTQVP